MRVGIYSDLRNPPPWRRPWSERFGRALDRFEAADAAGAGGAWLSEHHLFEDGYLPQPMTFAAAVAMRTKQARIGTAIMLAPLRPAIDIAEQTALVDQLSGGRLELGVGAGYRRAEFEAFGADISQRYELLEARVREVRELWAGGEVLPPPLQTPPEIWIGGTGPRAARMAGRLDAGLLWLKASLLEPYKRGLREAGHDESRARMGGLANLVLADDPEAAWPRIAPHLAYQRETYARYSADGTDARPTSLQAPQDDVDSLRVAAEEALPPTFDVVTPDEAIARLTRWLGPLPVAHVYLWESVAGMPDDLADRHCELVATRLAPALADVGIATPRPTGATP